MHRFEAQLIPAGSSQHGLPTTANARQLSTTASGRSTEVGGGECSGSGRMLWSRQPPLLLLPRLHDRRVLRAAILSTVTCYAPHEDHSCLLI
jgi:hypothetical protein